MSTGIANATPTLPLTPEAAIWAGTPTSSPAAFRSAPPELPWLTAASVWIAPVMEKPLGASIVRPRPDTMPALALPSYPKGSPIASTGSPTASFDESPRGIGSSSCAGTSILTSARSVEGSVPTTAARAVRPSASSTVTDCAPLTTCSLVRTWPSSSMTTPVPLLAAGPAVEMETTPPRRRA